MGAGFIALLFAAYIPAASAYLAGETLWTQVYDGPAHQMDAGTAVALDADNNAYVSSRVDNDYNFNSTAILKYTPAGNASLFARYSGAILDPKAIGLDADGNVYVGGTAGSEYHTPYKDIFIMKYSFTGMLQWTRRFSATQKSPEFLEGMVVTPNGNIYLTAVTEEIKRSTVNYDFVTVKYDSAGRRIWARRYDGPSHSADEPSALAIDKKGNVYVTGSSHGRATDCDFLTIKYNSNGQRQWVARYAGASIDAAWAIGVDNGGNVLVTGKSYSSAGLENYLTIKYGPNGATKWTRRYDGADNAIGLAIGPSGSVYVTGKSWGLKTEWNFVTVKYSTGGHLEWIRTYKGPGKSDDEPSKIATDDQGNVFVTGTSGSYPDVGIATIKYSSDGAQQWVRLYNGPGQGEDKVDGLAVSGNGYVHITGTTVSGKDEDIFTIKYAP